MLQEQTNAGENLGNQDSGKLIIREKIEGTPFQLINQDDKGWFISLGRYRMTEIGTNTKEELTAMVANKDWTLILDTIAVLTERHVKD